MLSIASISLAFSTTEPHILMPVSYPPAAHRRADPTVTASASWVYGGANQRCVGVPWVTAQTPPPRLPSFAIVGFAACSPCVRMCMGPCWPNCCYAPHTARACAFVETSEERNIGRPYSSGAAPFSPYVDTQSALRKSESASQRRKSASWTCSTRATMMCPRLYSASWTVCVRVCVCVCVGGGGMVQARLGVLVCGQTREVSMRRR